MTPALAHTPVLETARLVLRAPVASDWPAWREFMATDRAQFVNALARDDNAAWRAFGHFIGHWVLHGFGQFVITDRYSGAVLGSAGPWFPLGWPEQELGWLLWNPLAEGKGYAFEAVSAVRDHVQDHLGWDTAVSYIAPDNLRSLALAQRLGCVQDTSAATPGGFSTVQVWRHPIARADNDGNPEAYA
ncbi:MAG: GNAT family N-acetyltransferase [Rhodobacteraceae bacterium]|nr:GNAT family N-acetyltransferase [Paracoccaceae bacterium]